MPGWSSVIVADVRDLCVRVSTRSVVGRQRVGTAVSVGDRQRLVPAGTVSPAGPKAKFWIVIAVVTAAGWVPAEAVADDDDGVVVAVVGATVVVDGARRLRQHALV